MSAFLEGIYELSPPELAAAIETAAPRELCCLSHTPLHFGSTRKTWPTTSHAILLHHTAGMKREHTEPAPHWKSLARESLAVGRPPPAGSLAAAAAARVYLVAGCARPSAQCACALARPPLSSSQRPARSLFAPLRSDRRERGCSRDLRYSFSHLG